MDLCEETGSKALRASVIVGKPAAEVFPLLTDPAHLENWFAEQADVDLAAGRLSFWGRYTPDTPDRDAQHTRLAKAEAPRELCFEWLIRGSWTTVSIELLQHDAGTLVQLTHAGLPVRGERQGALHDFWYSALESLRLYAMTGRAQEMGEWGPKPGSSLSCAVEIEASAGEVYDKLINPDSLNRYFGSGARVDPRVGGEYTYGWEEGGPVKILDLSENERLSFSWKYDEEFETVVTWELAGSGGRTRLTLTHSGFAPDYDDEGYRAGWFSFLAIIKGMCELGEAWSKVEISGITHGEA